MQKSFPKSRRYPKDTPREGQAIKVRNEIGKLEFAYVLGGDTENEKDLTKWANEILKKGIKLPPEKKQGNPYS